MRWHVWNDWGTPEDGTEIEAPTPADAATAFARWHDGIFAEYPTSRIICVKPHMAVGTAPSKYEVIIESRPDYTATRIP